jgi:hypothetical protein
MPVSVRDGACYRLIVMPSPRAEAARRLSVNRVIRQRRYVAKPGERAAAGMDAMKKPFSGRVVATDG